MKQEEIILSVETIRTELLTQGDLYAGFLASIESALNEAKPYTNEHILAKAVLDRVAGIERREAGE